MPRRRPIVRERLRTHTSVVDERHEPGSRRPNRLHGGVRAAIRTKSAVGEENAEPRPRIHRHSRVTIIGADAEEVAVAHALSSLDEPVTDAVTVAECVED